MKVAAIDQGTTATKSFTLDDEGRFEIIASIEHKQIYPRAGWVEHDAEELLRNVKACLEAAGQVDAIGIDNQGETVIAWDANTGKPLYNAIVWQDDRTQDVTAKLKADGAEELTKVRAGLPLDPYFSASKLRWFIDNVDEAKTLLKQGRLRVGTSDAFFHDRLTGTFATDVTTASRTSLMSLATCNWDPNFARFLACLWIAFPKSDRLQAILGGLQRHQLPPALLTNRQPSSVTARQRKSPLAQVPLPWLLQDQRALMAPDLASCQRWPGKSPIGPRNSPLMAVFTMLVPP